jgi:hypothetical protein
MSTVEDSRGISGFAATMLALTLALAGGFVDAFIGARALDGIFGASFVVAAVLAAAVVSRYDALVTAITPPLVYVAAALIVAAVHGTTINGTWVVDAIGNLVLSIISGAGYLFGGTAVALLISLTRWWRSRPAETSRPVPGGRPVPAPY